MDKRFSVELSRRLHDEQRSIEREAFVVQRQEEASAEKKKRALIVRPKIVKIMRDDAAEAAKSLLDFGYEPKNTVKVRPLPEPVFTGTTYGFLTMVKDTVKELINPPDLTEKFGVWVVSCQTEKILSDDPYGGYTEHYLHKGICLSESGELFSYTTNDISGELGWGERVGDSVLVPHREIVTDIEEAEQQPIVKDWREKLLGLVSR